MCEQVIDTLYSPQWAEIFSPYPDAQSFAQQFDEPGLHWDVITDAIPSSQESGTTSTSSFTASDPSPQPDTCRCSLRGSDHSLEDPQRSLGSDGVSRIADSRAPINPCIVGEGNHPVVIGSSLGIRLPIRPADHPVRRPTRRQKVLQNCSVEGCGMVFACSYDLKRHKDDVHAQGTTIYKCGTSACGYVRPRKDKVRSHCTKRGHGDLTEIYVGLGQNSDQLMAMLEQRRKKGKRRSVCHACGREG